MRGARERLGHPIGTLVRDAGSLVRYGRNAPLRFQRVWFDAVECDRVSRAFRGGDWSGQVVGGAWDLDTEDVDARPILSMCRRRWEDGASWEEVGAYERLMTRIRDRNGPADGCLTLDEVVARYVALDALFDQVRAEGRLRPAPELPGPSFRERGGIRVHVDRDGGVIFASAGNHRLAIARILGLRDVPGELGVVHAEAIRRWRRRRHRSRTAR